MYNEQIFLDMLEDRNLTSHIYNSDMAKEIFGRIKKKYFFVIKEILTKIKRGIKNG